MTFEIIVLKMTNHARRACQLCTKLCLYLEHCPPRPQVLVIGRFSNWVETIKERRQEWWWSHGYDDVGDDDDDDHIRSVRSVRSLKRRPRVHSADYHIMRQRSRSLEQVPLKFSSDWGWWFSFFARGFWWFLMFSGDFCTFHNSWPRQAFLGDDYEWWQWWWQSNFFLLL